MIRPYIENLITEEAQQSEPQLKLPKDFKTTHVHML